jgi:hypothetical protein
MQPAGQNSGPWEVVEGRGWRAARIGATKQEVLAAFGQPEDRETYWLNYRRTWGIDVFYATRQDACEIRFNPGFQGALSSGVRIGSNTREVFAAYGDPLSMQDVPDLQSVASNRVLYRKGNTAKIAYPERGLLFWFDASGRVSQFVVFQASSGG